MGLAEDCHRAWLMVRQILRLSEGRNPMPWIFIMWAVAEVLIVGGGI